MAAPPQGRCPHREPAAPTRCDQPPQTPSGFLAVGTGEDADGDDGGHRGLRWSGFVNPNPTFTGNEIQSIAEEVCWSVGLEVA